VLRAARAYTIHHSSNGAASLLTIFIVTALLLLDR
jgi:hypothetical protein